jgi:uncharacterized membrane protein
MTGYLAAIFFATVFLFLLHLVEWRTASAITERLHSESKPVAEGRRLRRAIRLKNLYYFLILPLMYTPRSILYSGGFWLLQPSTMGRSGLR